MTIDAKELREATTHKGEREEALEAARKCAVEYREQREVTPVLPWFANNIIALDDEVTRLLSSSKAERELREALEKAEDALARAGYGLATSTETMQAARGARASRLAALPKEK